MLPTAAGRLLTATQRLGMTRLGLVLSAVSGGWLMAYLAFAVEPAAQRNPVLDSLGLGLTLLAATGAALGLGVCAVALNDILDRRQDRVLSGAGGAENKPVATGEVSAGAAAVVAVGALLVAVLSAGALGPTSLKLAVLLGAGVLFFNVAGRFVPAVGIVTLGLLQGLALALPNPLASFAWPVLLTMTHVMGCGLVRHHLENKRPRLRPRDVWGVLLGWGFWSLTVLLLINFRRPPGSPPGSAPGISETISLTWVWVGPAAAVLGFFLVSWWTLRRKPPGGPAGEQLPSILGRGRSQRFRRLSVGWLMVYDAAWLASAGLWWQGLSVLGLLGLVVLAARASHGRGVDAGRFIDELIIR